MPRLAGPVAAALAAILSSMPVTGQPAVPPAAGTAGVNREAMDPRVDPCADFYQYACGGWLASNPVPADQRVWSRFTEFTTANRARLRDILAVDAVDAADAAHAAHAVDTASAQAPSPSAATADRRILGDFYASCMDEDAVERRGIAAIQPDLDRIAALASPADLPPLLAHLRQIGVDIPFRLRADQDYKDATAVIATLEATGRALPDRDYYLKTDPRSEQLRAEYVKHVQRMLALLGEPVDAAAADAAAVVAMETALANAALDRVSRRDPERIYHKVSRQQLAALTPAFSWERFLAALDAPPIADWNVMEPDFLRAFDGLVRTLPPASWRAYLRWHLVHAAAPWLGRAFVAENFAYFDQQLTGARQPRPRWDRCVEETDRALGEALGRQYVAAWLDPGAKQNVLALVHEIEQAMAQDIAGLTWMGADTRRRAAEKLAAIAEKIGYPETWRDYGRLTVRRDDLIGNIQRAYAFDLARRLRTIGKPVDRGAWVMTPATVNAYYSTALNDINFPAGILQPPFYDPRRDDAVNYGAIGSAIGHEMTHGFDDEGSKFDAHGNLENWWTPADRAEFERRTACFADQYSAFPVAGDQRVNGRLTLGENTADNGGLRLAYMAYEASHAGKPRLAIDGLDPEQRFFVGFAQVWCANTTAEAERRATMINPHAPGRYRVRGTVVNMPEFQQAFGCAPGAPMAPAAPAARCRVW